MASFVSWTEPRETLALVAMRRPRPSDLDGPSARCRHTLWKRVQGVVTPLLASMVAIIDRDSNLELLATPNTRAWVRELWMFIFNDINLLSIPLVTNDAR